MQLTAPSSLASPRILHLCFMQDRYFPYLKQWQGISYQLCFYKRGVLNPVFLWVGSLSLQRPWQRISREYTKPSPVIASLWLSSKSSSKWPQQWGGDGRDLAVSSVSHPASDFHHGHLQLWESPNHFAACHASSVQGFSPSVQDILVCLSGAGGADSTEMWQVTAMGLYPAVCLWFCFCWALFHHCCTSCGAGWQSKDWGLAHICPYGPQGNNFPGEENHDWVQSVWIPAQVWKWVKTFLLFSSGSCLQWPKINHLGAMWPPAIN